MNRFFAVAVAAAACSYTDGGSGTKTLKVEATVVYQAANNSSEAEILVSRQDAQGDWEHVEGASVKLHDAESGEDFLLQEQAAGNNERYRASFEGYHRRLELRVDQGNDNLEARLEGPGTHVITKPRNGERLNRGDIDSLKVEWQVSDGVRADQIFVDATDNGGERCYDSINREDEEGHTTLQCDELEADNLDVSVERKNKVKLKGGVSGSLFTTAYKAVNTINGV